MKLHLLTILSVLVILRNYEYVRYNNRFFPSKEVAVFKPEKTYTCIYSGLWCTCYSRKGGGCMVGCSPSDYFRLYNQTSCPLQDNFVLSGFE